MLRGNKVRTCLCALTGAFAEATTAAHADDKTKFTIYGFAMADYHL